MAHGSDQLSFIFASRHRPALMPCDAPRQYSRAYDQAQTLHTSKGNAKPRARLLFYSLLFSSQRSRRAALNTTSHQPHGPKASQPAQSMNPLFPQNHCVKPHGNRSPSHGQAPRAALFTPSPSTSSRPFYCPVTKNPAYLTHPILNNTTIPTNLYLSPLLIPSHHYL